MAFLKLRVIAFMAISFFMISSSVAILACDLCAEGTTMGGDFQFDANVCVGAALATNKVVPCDATAAMLVDFADTNSLVIREKTAGGDINDCLAVASAGITASKNVTLTNNLAVNGKVTQGSGSNVVISGLKVLDSTITETAATALTVNFSQDSGASFVHVVLFGATGSGDIKYDAWIFLGTGNSIVKSSARDVTAGPVPAMTVSFNTSTGTASFALATGAGESITSPVMFYEVYGNKISSVS